MTSLCCDVLNCLQGKTLATAESCTGGMIGAALTAVPGSSRVYKGGVISYCDRVKHMLLAVDQHLLDEFGAVSAQVAEAMAAGARKGLDSTVAVSVTGLAGPEGDGSSHPVGTVFIGYSDENTCLSKQYLFSGDRNAVRDQAARAALLLVLKMQVPPA